ncbi:MAG: HAMP domain-containing sensor histidine kinase [Eubacteriales bacterium]|nr:HAMP domain-containing sensor histidine kinase [Eubacteriales bacterium]
MKRIRNNKIVRGTVFAVLVIALTVFILIVGIFFTFGGQVGYENMWDKDYVYAKAMCQMAEGYKQDAVDYFILNQRSERGEALNGGQRQRLRELEIFFSPEHTNYRFSISMQVGEDDYSFGNMKSGESFGWKDREKYYETSEGIEGKFCYSIDSESIYNELDETERANYLSEFAYNSIESFLPEYKDGDTAIVGDVLTQPGILEDYYLRINDGVEIPLCALKGLSDSFFETMESYPSNMYSYIITGISYNPNNSKLFIDYEIYEIWCLDITSAVTGQPKTDDEFTSAVIQYMRLYFDVQIPATVISFAVSLLCIIYLMWSFGGKTAEEDAVCDRRHIPLDILLLVGAVAVYVCWTALTYRSRSVFSLTGIAVSVLESACLAVLFSSILCCFAIGRRRGFAGMRDSMISVIFIKWLGKNIRRIWDGIKRSTRFFWDNLNIYWKWLGCFSIVAFTELLFVRATDSLRCSIFIGIVNFIVIAFILIFVLIQLKKLESDTKELANGNMNAEIRTDKMFATFRVQSEALNRIRDGIQVAVEERMKSERMKTELITNVSHDIKTPLTSIISYVDLLKKEDIKGDRAKEYIDVLERQSGRLKKLISDLIDVSKASSGSMPVVLANVDVHVLLEQALGEFTEKLDNQNIRVIVQNNAANTYVCADGKLMWRVFENLIGNIVKYTQPGTRVYVEIREVLLENMQGKEGLSVILKNISKDALNISPEELMERFVRGDSSRNTEGSGLGLSIAKSLMELQNGTMEIDVDGDLFKVTLGMVRDAHKF